MKKSLSILFSFIFCISLLSVSACSKTPDEEATNQEMTEMAPEIEEQIVPENVITSDMESEMEMEEEIYTDEEQ